MADKTSSDQPFLILERIAPNCQLINTFAPFYETNQRNISFIN